MHVNGERDGLLPHHRALARLVTSRVLGYSKRKLEGG